MLYVFLVAVNNKYDVGYEVSQSLLRLFVRLFQPILIISFSVLLLSFMLRYYRGLINLNIIKFLILLFSPLLTIFFGYIITKLFSYNLDTNIGRLFSNVIIGSLIVSHIAHLLIIIFCTKNKNVFYSSNNIIIDIKTMIVMSFINSIQCLFFLIAATVGSFMLFLIFVMDVIILLKIEFRYLIKKESSGYLYVFDDFESLLNSSKMYFFLFFVVIPLIAFNSSESLTEEWGKYVLFFISFIIFVTSLIYILLAYMKGSDLSNILDDKSKDLSIVMGDIGKHYYFGLKNFVQNYEIACKYFLTASLMDDSDSLYYLGDMFYFGKGVGINKSKAHIYWEKAAEKGNAHAQYMLGALYSNIKDIEDIVESQIKEPCYYDFPDRNPAYLYSLSNGKEILFKNSYLWMRLAAKRGHKNAQLHFASMHNNGMDSEIKSTDPTSCWTKETVRRHVWGKDILSIDSADFSSMESCDDSENDLIFKKVPKIVPSENCLLCGRSLNETKGHMLKHGHKYSLYLSLKKRNENYYKSIFLKELGEIFLVIRGPFTPEIIRKAISEFENNKHPWFCQTCDGFHLCKVCNTPIVVPQGSDVIRDDGSYGHYAILGVAIRCQNENCPNFRK